MLKVTWNMIISINANQVCWLHYAIQVNNTYNSLTIFIKLWFYHPHASVWTEFLFNYTEPLD